MENEMKHGHSGHVMEMGYELIYGNKTFINC